MIDLLGALARPALVRLDPETAHGLTIRALQAMPLPSPRPDDPRLAVEAFGLAFANPLGLAAGFDKHAEVPDAMLRLGFGFVEIGTVTPRAQPGNPQPRLFRLARDEAVINRLGFNSAGHVPVRRRLAARVGRRGIVGVNIGANKTSTDRAADYVAAVDVFADLAAYFTVNVSSPNTPGLRDLQQAEALDELLARVLAARDTCAERHGRRPVLLKIAPDLDLAALDSIIAIARARRIDGLIVANTTVARPATLADAAAREAGGLSGRPLFALSTQMLAAAYLRVERQFPLIGVGGVDSAATAFAKLEAGASLVQFYSSLVFKGPALVGRIKRGLLRLLAQKSYPRLADATGVAAADWAAGKLCATSDR